MLANHVSDRTGAIRIDKRDIVSDPYDEDIQVRNRQKFHKKFVGKNIGQKQS